MNKTIIKQFAQVKSKKFAQKTYSDFMDVMFSILDDTGYDLKYFTPDTTKIVPIGEYTSDAFIEEKGGEIEIFVAIADPQVVLATKRLAEDFLSLSHNRIPISKVKTKLKRKQKRQVTAPEEQKLNEKNTCQEVLSTIFKHSINYFDETTKLLMYESGIKIFAQEEYGFNFLIRLGTVSQNDNELITSIWNPVNYTLNNVDIFGYSDALEDKNMITRGNFYKFVRILKNFRKTMLINRTISASTFNRYMVEQIAYNVPNELLSGSDFDIFVKGCNYLVNVAPSKLRTFDNKPINSFYLCQPSSVFSLNKFMANLRKLTYKL